MAISCQSARPPTSASRAWLETFHRFTRSEHHQTNSMPRRQSLSHITSNIILANSPWSDRFHHSRCQYQHCVRTAPVKPVCVRHAKQVPSRVPHHIKHCMVASPLFNISTHRVADDIRLPLDSFASRYRHIESMNTASIAWPIQIVDRR